MWSPRRDDMGKLAVVDIKDATKLNEKDGFLKCMEIADIIRQKGFCIFKGDLNESVNKAAVKEAGDSREAGDFTQLYQEVLDGYLGSSGSAWTKKLEETSRPGEESLRIIEKYLVNVGEHLAGSSVAFLNMHVAGRMPTMLNWSRILEDRDNSTMTDLKEAESYLYQFSLKYLRILYYAGEYPAVLNITPIGCEDEFFLSNISAGMVVIVRSDVCRCAVDVPQAGIGMTMLVDLHCGSAENPDVVPHVFARWMHARFRAIVVNNVLDDIPDPWLKRSRQMIYDRERVYVAGSNCELPSLTMGDGFFGFVAASIRGVDCIGEIPICKWDITSYYDEDPSNGSDFKMYARHMGALEFKDYEYSDYAALGLTKAEAKRTDMQQMVLFQSISDCLIRAGLPTKSIKGKDLGIFSGLSQSAGDSCKPLAGMSRATYSNYICYKLGSTGPSMAVDTEDSSSSAALDTAKTYMHAGKCSQSLASGVHLITNPYTLVLLCAAGNISTTGRCRVFDESSDGYIRSDGVVTMFLVMDDTNISHIQGEIRGSAMNSKGFSSSLTSMSASAVKDILLRATKESRFETVFLDAIEVHASGQRMPDAIEFGIMRVTLQSGEKGGSFQLRNVASALGNTGAAKGLVSCAKVLALFSASAHGPCLHLRQLFEIGLSLLSFENEEFNEEVKKSRIQIASEIVKEDIMSSAGVTSFGSSGTNVHHVLVGYPKQANAANCSAASKLHWFPSRSPEPTTHSYHIIGSWNAYSESFPMEFEGDGVYGYTVILGENLWETFLFWIDGDRQQVLHPGRRFSDHRSKVLGPKMTGREYNWRLDARGLKVRMITEAQMQALETRRTDQIAEGELPEALEQYRVAFPGDAKPASFEECDVSEMPLLSGQEEKGCVGDQYRVRLEVRGSFRRVTWKKMLDPPKKSPYQHAYFIVGDHNDWTWQEMQQEDEFHVAEISCTKEASAFLIARDRDWDQCFYPECPELISRKSSSCKDGEIHGPDELTLSKLWVLPSHIGDKFEIKFSRIVQDNGEESTRLLTWNFRSTSTIDREDSAHAEYDILISSQKFEVHNGMEYNQETQTFSGGFFLGSSGKEKMIILKNHSWFTAIHPNVDRAHFLDPGHSVQGPDRNHAYWLVGKSIDKLKPGDIVLVEMKLEDGVPKSVSWEKYSATSMRK